MTAALYALGFVLALCLVAVLCHLRDLRLYREDCERDEPVGDSGRRVIKAPPRPVKALGVMQIGDTHPGADGLYASWWTVLYTDGAKRGRYKTAEEARERLDNAKRP